MNSCSRTFLLVGLVVTILLALYQLPNISVGGVELRHVNILSDILPEPYMLEDTEDIIPVPVPVPSPNVSIADSTKKQLNEIHPEGVMMIDDYSAGAAGGMSHFYKMLNEIASIARPVRVAYYGDSFIEGDILTCDLRESLQLKFGGNGVGWVDCCSRVGGFRRTINHVFGGFKEYEVVKKPFSHNYEGINQRYFIPSEGAFISLKGTRYKKHSSHWQIASLYLRTDSTLAVNVSVDGNYFKTFNVNASPYIQKLVVEDTMRNIKYKFEDICNSAYVYGVALESRQGVILDNFSMRGSAGHTLANIPQRTLRDFARYRPYDLIILHFGLNIINEKSNATNYKAYVRRMKNAVNNLRTAYPDASILVVSVPDRDQRTEAGIKTMNGVEALASYQKLLASECGVAYFNLFEAMGGRESMKNMVEKGWANKDYTHLSFAGGEYVAGLLYDSFIAGYENYKLRNNIK